MTLRGGGAPPAPSGRQRRARSRSAAVVLTATVLPALAAPWGATPAGARSRPAASERQQKRKTARTASGGGGAKTRAPATHCKEPEPVSPDLAAGLDLYRQGRWTETAARLGPWSASPDAESDPARAKGLYALGYALRLDGRDAEAQAALVRAEALLAARVAEDPTLEAYYYLAALRDSKKDEAATRDVVSRALAALDGGQLCATPDGDDYFREARLQSFAGHAEIELALLEKAAAAYAQGRGTVPAYRALVERRLGEQAMAENRLADAETHLAGAAVLDPTMPNVHRLLGTTKLRRGDVKGAADYWRANWKKERNNGNDLTYVIPLLDRIVRYRDRFGDQQRLADLEALNIPTLGERARTEATTFMQLTQEKAQAAGDHQPFPKEKDDAMAAADYHMAQYLVEYFERGADLPEFALQNGLLAAIHNRTLPEPKPPR